MFLAYRSELYAVEVVGAFCDETGGGVVCESEAHADEEAAT